MQADMEMWLAEFSQDKENMAVDNTTKKCGSCGEPGLLAVAVNI